MFVSLLVAFWAWFPILFTLKNQPGQNTFAWARVTHASRMTATSRALVRGMAAGVAPGTGCRYLRPSSSTGVTCHPPLSGFKRRSDGVVLWKFG